MQYSLALEKGR